ncbi:MAG TPA: YqgE/AlgH family protein [Woeseiaceae bacterium]|nr:YqgE/AlgH family protein [Woeseiaceae bacterium]
MTRVLTWLLAVASLLPAVVDADSRPARGKLLVATEVVQGEMFANTVVLLLHYDDTGAFGLVVNRPTDVQPAEVLGDDETLADYRGSLFWGGPVHMDSLRALLLTDSPPAESEQIIDSVYLVAYEDALAASPADTSRLRLFIGYAGWAPGQLDGELARGSWRVRPASSELVFDKEPGTLWKRLAPTQEQRAAL